MLAISIGDINGIGLEIALRAHKHISQYCTPLYVVHKEIMLQGAKMLGLPMPKDMACVASFKHKDISIKPGKVSAKAGAYSFKSVKNAISLVESKQAKALVTLPIHKSAWQKAKIKYIGHTDMLSHHFKKQAIMMLGCEAMYVALFSEHIALSEVSKRIKTKPLCAFLLDFARVLKLQEPCCVLGLNPHCGDNGLMGSEDKYINKAIEAANNALGKALFFGAYPPDSAFSPQNRAKFRYFVSMYHDVGLAPLKALYFESSINVSLNLPILRTSVDHGVAFDKAYSGAKISIESYINAIKYAKSHA